MVSQVKFQDNDHYDCFGCGTCSGDTIDRKAFPYFYIDHNTYCPQCYPGAIKIYKEEFEGVNTALVQE